MKRLMTAVMAMAAALGACAAVEPPAMGWSTWNTYGMDISEELMRKQAEAMVKLGLADCGYRYVNIDDGWFDGRDEKGRLRVNPKRFPNGFKPWIEYCHSLGLKAGIYSDAGENTCGSCSSEYKRGYGVGFAGHDREDAEFYFKEHDFDFIKVDFCGAMGGLMGPNKRPGNVGQTNMPARARYEAIAAAIKAVGRPEVRLNVCRWQYPGTWVSDVASSWRIGTDIEANWRSVSDIIRESWFLAPYAGGGHYNDLDMLEVGRGMTLEEDRTHFATWCMMASPLMIGCDLATIPPAALDLLKNRELIAINQDPLGLAAKVVKFLTPDRAILVKDVETLGGTNRVVAFVNLADNDYVFRFSPSDVDLVGRVVGREVVAGGREVTLSGLFTCMVPGHGTRVWKLSGERRRERSRYPAHWAWLSLYQEIDSGWRSPSYHYCAECGTVAVENVGGRADSWMEWRDVLSERGGDYFLDFDLQYKVFDIPNPGPSIGFDVTVNGKPAGFCGESSGWRIAVKLKPGANVVKIGNASLPIMPVRGMKLTR